MENKFSSVLCHPGVLHREFQYVSIHKYFKAEKIVHKHEVNKHCLFVFFNMNKNKIQNDKHGKTY